MNEEQLAKRVYDLARDLWFRLVHTPGGHCGPAGPSGTDESWTMTQGYLAGAAKSLEEVLSHTNTGDHP
jgi:hypothetical protein